MSAVGNQEVLTPILLRSTTPAPGEKVMKYLQSMEAEGEKPDTRPPRSVLDSVEYQSNGSAVRSPRSTRSFLNGNGPLPTHDDDINGGDVDSNFQEGRTSEIGDMEPGKEPGPHDPPGPKYESYDSGPSFGNFGPLPDDPPTSSHPYAFNTWNPNLSDIMSSPRNETPGNPVKIPLPPSEFATSPRAPSLRMDSQTPKPRSQTGTATSPKPYERVMSPKSVRSNSRGLEEERPLSPMSVRSKATARTRGTEKGTAYPPLPESRYGEGESNFDIGSPRSRGFPKAPSISPSDSPSNFKPPKQAPNGNSRSPVVASPFVGYQTRPFSPYRHGPTTSDLLHAAARNRSLVIPEEDEKASTVRSKQPSIAPSQISKPPSQLNGKAPSQAPSQVPSQSPSKTPSKVPTKVPSKAPSQASAKQPSALSYHDRGKERERTPSPDGLDPEEAQIVADALGGLTPRTSYYAEQPLEPDVTNHYHDTELCVLLHQEADGNLHDLVRRALRKAIRQRVKKLGMKSDAESIKQYRKSYHDHDPGVHLLNAQLNNDDPPKWAVDLKREIVLMQQRLESISENLKPQDHSYQESRFAYEGDEYTRMAQAANIQTDNMDSMYQTHPEEETLDDNATGTQKYPQTDATSQFQDYTLGDLGRDDSPGSIVLEKELYKLRQKPASQSGRSHRTWEITRGEETGDFDDDDGPPPSGLPTIPDTNGDGYADHDRTPSPPLPPLPNEDHEVDDDFALAQQQQHGDISDDQSHYQLPPWQKIHSRLLNWAIIWPTSEFDHALNSTTRGNQVDEVALSIWATQTYKRYVRARLTEGPSGVVDRLFVPPNVADVINNAVFNGRHGEACGMLKDLWTPFGLEGMPRLIIVLAKHRSDPNHWVVHRFSLPEGKLATYDTYQDRTLPDGRPLGWWFAIRIAWPNAPYPSPESLVQKMIRLHRPMQLNIENSVAAAGIWRNLLMGSRAERSLDLERLRDLINTEVKNLRQRKQLGKLSIGTPKANWEQMGT